MAHMKRISMPKTWPLKKKGKSFVIKAHSPYKLKDSLPLLVLIRDILGAVDSFREGKKVIKAGKILVNNKIIKNEKYGVGIFDKISIPEINKFFEIIVKKKIGVREISKEESTKKICKVIGKKVLNKNKIQINLFGGKNIILKKENKVGVGDSIVLNLENFSIIKILPLEKNVKCIVIGGKHIGKEGKVVEIEEGSKKAVYIEDKNGEKIKIIKKNLLVIE